MQRPSEMVTPSRSVKHSNCIRCKAEIPPGDSFCDGFGDMLCAKCAKELEEMRINDKLQRIGIMRRYIDATVKNFVGNGKLIDKVNELANAKAQDILICGPCGCGKTHIAAAFVRLLLEDHRIDVSGTCFLPVVDFLLQVKATFNSRDDSELEIIKRYARYRLLVLDDLGSEKPGEWAATTIYALIDRRYREDRPTLITTNLTLEQIEQQLGSRTASRLSQYTLINISMPDYRKKRKE